VANENKIQVSMGISNSVGLVPPIEFTEVFKVDFQWRRSGIPLKLASFFKSHQPPAVSNRLQETTWKQEA